MSLSPAVSLRRDQIVRRSWLVIPRVDLGRVAHAQDGSGLGLKMGDGGVKRVPVQPDGTGAAARTVGLLSQP